MKFGLFIEEAARQGFSLPEDVLVADNAKIHFHGTKQSSKVTYKITQKQQDAAAKFVAHVMRNFTHNDVYKCYRHDRSCVKT
eukprot:8101135-Ditylum_brightwellii.AAC.1